MSTKKITTVGMLCAMAMIVNVFISFPIVPAVSFLRYDPKDILIVIGGFIYGPMTSLLMSFICLDEYGFNVFFCLYGCFCI